MRPRTLHLALAACLAAPLCPTQAAWHETTLFSFNDLADGGVPSGTLIPDSAGNLYGTARDGGQYGHGVVFELSPPQPGQTAWTETVLHAFDADGAYPVAGLIRDANGNLFGTTQSGGANNDGTAFELSPPANGHTAWTATVLHNFTGGADGREPLASLTLDPSGNLYGTAWLAGPHTDGEVFQLTPPAEAQGSWTFTSLFAFHNKFGRAPQSSLLRDNAGNLYGTNYCNEAGNHGTVFEISPPAPGQTRWTRKDLHNIPNPDSRLVRDKAGNLFGDSVYGGPGLNPFIFELTPPADGSGRWREKIIYQFSNSAGTDGLTIDDAGNLFAATGTGTGGTVFELKHPAPGKYKWTNIPLFTFNGNNGAEPSGVFTIDKAGNLLGTTGFGGQYDYGTAFMLTRP